VQFSQGWIRQNDIGIQEEVLGLDISVNDVTLVNKFKLGELLMEREAVRTSSQYTI
jgi:hypothetical protein